MEKRIPAKAPTLSAPDSQADVLARLEAALRAIGAPQLPGERDAKDPYNTAQGPIRRDVWGARAR